MNALDPRTTALVLVDLQKGIVERVLAPRSGTDVLAASKNLAGRFRKLGAPVVLVHVGFSPDYADALKQPVDKPNPRPAGGMPADFSAFADGLAAPEDIIILKRQWGAFYGTDLDLQLRRRGMDTIVLGGIATNFGVESTARDAWERGYNLVFAEDAMTSMSAEMHNFSVREIFPRIGVMSEAAAIFS